jgi:gamma-glutamylcyclotransferase (GGCT)/AIG2-like uncharacterized protein YtfP
MNAACRLVAYGTLAPGRPNHHQLDGLSGRWLAGRVHGALVQQGWGAALGYPALVLNPDGPALEVQIFESIDLPSHWPRLDDFEGPGYQHVVVPVETADGRPPRGVHLRLQARLGTCRPHPVARSSYGDAVLASPTVCGNLGDPACHPSRSEVT